MARYPAGISRLSFNLAAIAASMFGFIRLRPRLRLRLGLRLWHFLNSGETMARIGHWRFARNFPFSLNGATHTPLATHHSPPPCYCWKGNVNVNCMSGLGQLQPHLANNINRPRSRRRPKESRAGVGNITERKLKGAKRKQHRNRKRMRVRMRMRNL